MSEKQKKSISVSTSAKKKRMKVSDHPAFGMWKDRYSDKDVPAVVRKLRKGRFNG